MVRLRAVGAGAIVAATLGAGIAFAHFHTFWPEVGNGYGKLGQRVTYKYFWGHPYEFIVFDTPQPKLYVVAPTGAKAELAAARAQMKDEESGQMRQTSTFSYTPQAVGDFYIVLEGPPMLIEEEEEIVQDYVKQCLHVMAEKGWDRTLGLPIEIVPLTRPYGLEEGFAFVGRALLDGKPLADAMVEVEKFNGFHVGEEALPKDAFGMEDVPMVTRVVKTDANGYFTCTLPQAGWWVISVSAESGTAQAEGKQYPRVLRGCLWVPVAKRFTLAR